MKKKITVVLDLYCRYTFYWPILWQNIRYHNLNPECTAATPKLRSWCSTALNPASLIIPANFVWSGNCRMDSTRY